MDAASGQLPAITALTYAPPVNLATAGVVTVTLDAVPGPPITGGVFALASPANPIATGSNGGTATIVIDVDPATLLDPDETYGVALSISASGQWGVPAPLVFQMPVLTAIDVVGDAVNVRWSLPPQSNIVETNVAIYDTVHDRVIASATTGALSVMLFPQQPVDPTGNYVVQAYGINGVASGPVTQSSESLILTWPAIASTTYDTNAIAIVAAGGTPPYTIYAQLLSDGLLVSEVAATGTNATIPLTAPLDAASRWQVALRYRSSIAAGPTGVAVELPMTAPALTQATYDGTQFTIDWLLPAMTTGASVRILDSGSNVVGSQDVAYGTSAIVTNATITAGASYSVVLAPYSGTARGLFGNATALIVAAPQMTSAISDGETLVVAMSNIAAPATGSVLQLASNGATIATQSAGTNGGIMALPSSLLAAPAIGARAIGPNVLGPASANPIALVTESPVIGSIAVANGNVTVTWTFSGTATQYQIELLNGAAADLLGHSGTSPATLALPATIAPGATITVRVVNATATGPRSAAVPLLTNAPAIGAPQYDGSVFTIAWSASTDAGVLGYTVALIDSANNSVASISTPATTASVLIELTAGATYSVTITPFGAGTTAPTASQSFTVPGEATIETTQYDGAMLDVTWSTVASATFYFVDVLIDYEPALQVSESGTSASIAASFAPGANVSVIVTAIIGNVSGPPSAPMDVVTIVPSLTNVFYDGTNLNASWSTQGGDAPSYTLAVLQGTTVVGSQSFTGNSGSFAVALPASGYTTSVWGVAGSAEGPASEGVDPQSGATGYFFAPASANVAPFVFRSAARPPYSSALAAEDVTLYFPNLFTTDPPAGSSGQTTFTLTAEGSNPATYSITVAASVVWNFSAASRTQLRGDFLKFVIWLETGAPLPGAIPYVVRALSLGMPLLFSETLLYRYGFNPANRYIDLVPGMKLRLEPEAFQLTQNAANQGFVTTASATYDITAALSGSVLNLAYDAFLSALTGNQIETSTKPGAAGIYDMYGTGAVKPYYRLFYPAKFVSSSADTTVDVTKVVAFAGCTSVANIEATTVSYLTRNTFGSTATVTFFRGRLIALPKIAVVVDGTAVDVAVGTTLRQLLGSWANLPFGQSLQLSGISVERAVGGVIDAASQLTAPMNVAQYERIDFSDQTMPDYSGAQDWFDLPLLGGDRVTIGGAR
jgi:hypothetical protein